MSTSIGSDITLKQENIDGYLFVVKSLILKGYKCFFFRKGKTGYNLGLIFELKHQTDLNMFPRDIER